MRTRGVDHIPKDEDFAAATAEAFARASLPGRQREPTGCGVHE
ncbi:hypothetical protein ABIA35_008380 [Catenulispora sp. MAP12-49]